MKRYIGAGLLVLGFLLAAYGLESSESILPRRLGLFTSLPVGGPGLLLIGATVAMLVSPPKTPWRLQRA